jgi:hypothetical protein
MSKLKYILSALPFTLPFTLLFLIVVVIQVSAWLNHIITCIQTEQWLLLLAGAIAFPIGIIHGIGLWIGVF